MSDDLEYYTNEPIEAYPELCSWDDPSGINMSSPGLARSVMVVGLNKEFKMRFQKGQF